uniref:DNA polymerase epsilon catalytic subunit n=1 Tax=Plectus sambesii TaxID=2011161 RepID=A0A914W395_9BILA
MANANDPSRDPLESGTSSDSGSEFRLRRIRLGEEIDVKLGYERYTDAAPRVAWLVNVHSSELLDEDKRIIAAVDYYFLQEDGARFKVSLPYKPYFYVAARPGCEKEVHIFLSKRYFGVFSSVELVDKEDLDLPNHLIGLKRSYLKLSFPSVTELQKVKKELMTRVRKNKERDASKSDYTEMLARHLGAEDAVQMAKKQPDQLENIVDIREYDVPYHVRVAIDLKIFVGLWYTVIGRGPERLPVVERNTDFVAPPDPVVLAFDIETTKLPLKFPDSEIDQIMMISYMIDGRGFLIVNREIVSADIDDFEYTPKPEYEGVFTVFNEADERATIVRFFEHIIDVKPHIIVTYNGDFFDWPFVEARAAKCGLQLLKEIGFEKDAQEEYKSRPCIHMDAFRWVKRDSYLPMGSQNLKACTKAKLRYDPVELDPEEMCRMAREQPQVLASYSVSDAVATYYLYMKYVHPFVFALCTIIPMEPDEVLRKGSGTLCEALLMVEAFHANIIFPNKQEQVHHKTTADGHLLESETYVGGHVEALESGVFRADIPCRFRLVPEAFDQLAKEVCDTMRHALEVENGVPVGTVTNFNQVCDEIRDNLCDLRDTPARLENPIIYHLDVGAMYPNIILTNRLQPPAIINETVCAACDYNRPGAKCQRTMEWVWRGEIIPANRSEYQRIVQQLENEKFPPLEKGGPQRAFHQLTKEEQLQIEKKRLQGYCRRAYKRQHDTRTEVRKTMVCQRENSFYVDTVRAFRDRRYEYKGMLKGVKKQLGDALTSGDAAEIKVAKAKEVLYDSLQLAHKCILNSFYGYVMRKGSRWFSMEMAGIVCHTGANIIKKARELVEQIGRPLELDTDGIWCILPASFPENVTFLSTHPGKSKVTISYPGAMLNALVKDSFTNDQYHTLQADGTYTTSSENSIFFEVDGPYLAMVLPASKEEGKKLKKRYAVFNFDGSLAELKGFEVKRRGELALIKIFQSSVFEAFLKGKTLAEVYDSVAKVANYWVDVLFSKAVDMPDAEVFDLISENRSMSRKLEDYGEQKSTSISTAKRLSEFLGDQMVKDAGLACKFIIARKPEGAPVTERAIPLAIFQAEPGVKRHYLRKWLKMPGVSSFDIRDVIDWNYYIERLGSTIQKIITIPAALQGVANPVARIPHPDWLHKRLVEKNDVMRQRRITDVFKPAPKVAPIAADIEDMTAIRSAVGTPEPEVAVVGCSRKRTLSGRLTSMRRNPLNEKNAIADGTGNVSSPSATATSAYKNWRDVLGKAPALATCGFDGWLQFHRSKWALQRTQQKQRKKMRQQLSTDGDRRIRPAGVGMDMFMRASSDALLELPWQILQIVETRDPGQFFLWVLLGQELRKIRLNVPRIFYVNQKTPKEHDSGPTYRRVTRLLPRSNPVHHLYEYFVPEDKFQQHLSQLNAELSAPHVEGIYETHIPLMFRVLADVGCIAQVTDTKRKQLHRANRDAGTFDLRDLEFRSMAQCRYLEDKSLRHIYLYHFSQDSRAVWGLFIPAGRKAHVWVLNRVRTEGIPNLNALYDAERNRLLEKDENASLPKADHAFELHVETSVKEVYRGLQRVLRAYRDEKRGPTFVAIQSPLELDHLYASAPQLTEFPIVRLHVSDSSTMYSALDWQRIGARRMIQHYLNSNVYLDSYSQLCRYLHIPLGNVPKDVTLFGADLFFARHLRRQNHVLWASPAERPDLGGKELDDNRLLTDIFDWTTIGGRSAGRADNWLVNDAGFFPFVCVELDIAALPVTALLQSHRIAEAEGGSSAVSFDAGPLQFSVDEMVASGAHAGLKSVTAHDETALSANAFKVLKQMVHDWVRDIAQYKNEFADEQIVHFYRWLRSHESLLYEPALNKTLQGLIKKLTLLLIAELKRLGVTVVYANFNRVVICTHKKSIEDANGFVTFLLDCLRKKELFTALDINPKRMWNMLSWLDPANYGGIRAATSTEESVGDENKELLPEEKMPEVDMHWTVMHFLPDVAACRTNFKMIIAGYLLVVYNKQIELTRQASGFALTQQVEVKKDDDELSELTRFCLDLINGELMQRMFSIVQKIQRKITVDSVSADVEDGLFPQLPGSYLTFRSPALELAKSICKVLSLDSALADGVNKLQRDLLKLVGVGEFAEEADWRDPCLSYILPETICKHCQHCSDLDLCRDASIFVEDGKIGVWKCESCARPYDVSAIERTLISHVNRLSMAYQLQDLKCSKCRGVKQPNAAVYCECSGPYVTTFGLDDLRIKMTSFVGLTKFYDMPNLRDACAWIVAGNSGLRHLKS